VLAQSGCYSLCLDQEPNATPAQGQNAITYGPDSTATFPCGIGNCTYHMGTFDNPEFSQNGPYITWLTAMPLAGERGYRHTIGQAVRRNTMSIRMPLTRSTPVTVRLPIYSRTRPASTMVAMDHSVRRLRTWCQMPPADTHLHSRSVGRLSNHPAELPLQHHL
jgi:hypothetical protein